MKLIIAIVQDKDSHLLSDEFANANVRATRLSTTGGFLRAGNTTFLVGIEKNVWKKYYRLFVKTVNQENN